MHSSKKGKHALLLTNPNARRGNESIDLILSTLQKGGLHVTVRKLEHLPVLARDSTTLRHEYDLIIISGGDGSLSAAATMVMESGLPMGIIPMGTANDLARTLSIPLDVQQAASIILRGKKRMIDLGTVNDCGFFNVASIGLSTDLAQKLDPNLKKRFGRFGYALAAMKIVVSASRFPAYITENSHTTKVQTYQIAVGNGVHYGSGNIVSDAAEIDDGHLDMYSLEMLSLWRLLLMFPVFRLGRHGVWREVRTARALEFEITTRTTMPVNADGELVTSTPAHFKVHPGAVSVFVP